MVESHDINKLVQSFTTVRWIQTTSTVFFPTNYVINCTFKNLLFSFFSYNSPPPSLLFENN